ncbi:flavin reductase family protein [Streptomyces hoynatensis]|uniref:Flavin reductase n=1 Tax=Streptomyces hoynatensis TaxID=1141874 RepID=A0A3A9YWG3_9ACTN|nr:flavin reductase family protein [Streptomyces hoynatensis]RKN40412.1 flavin reductase [Streptomyces hoynatensis]
MSVPTDRSFTTPQDARAAGRNPVPEAAPDPEAAPGPADVLRSTLRRQALGVAVITVPGPAGFTATSFTSVSLHPALVSFYLGASASAAPAVLAAERFAAHLLAPRHAGLAEKFARSGIDRFAGTDWRPGAGNVPLLEGVSAWLTARITLRRPIGDHLLVVGEVEAGATRAAEPALLHHDGAFARSAPL